MQNGTIDTNFYSTEIQDLIDKLLIKDYHERYDIDKVYDLVLNYNKKIYLKNNDNNNNNSDDVSKNILNNQKIFLKKMKLKMNSKMKIKMKL